MQEKSKTKLHLRKGGGKIIETPESTKTSKTEEMSSKMGEVKEGASEKKEDVEIKMSEVKEKMGEKKEDVDEKIQDVKEGAEEKTEEVKENLSEAKEEAAKKKEELKKESEKEGMTPAEKVLNDIVTRLRQGTGQINEAISDYTSDQETSKNVVEKPLVDVLETNDTIVLMADISGVKKEDINIGISKNSVEITAMYKEEPEIEDAKFTMKERSYGKTHRTITLPTEIKIHEAKAKFKDCTLAITLPKVVEDITKINID
jgi:HSP20 family protein